MHDIINYNYNRIINNEEKFYLSHCALAVLHMILRDEVYFLPVDSDTCLLSCSLSSFRSLFSRKPKEPKATSHSSAGWRLFGKTAAREGDTSKDLASTPTAEQVGSLNTHNHIIIILLLLRPGCLICSQSQSVLYKGMKLSWVNHLSET